jgi:hypothetical protein
MYVLRKLTGENKIRYYSLVENATEFNREEIQTRPLM